MESIIDRRLFFKIAATGVAGYFVSPMETFAQTHHVESRRPAAQHGEERHLHSVAGRAQPDRHVRSARRTMDSEGFRSDDDQRHRLAGRLVAESGDAVQPGRFSIIRSCQSTALVHPLLQNWTQIARNPTSATGKIAPNMGSVVALEMEKQRAANQKLPGFVSLNGGGSLAGAGYFSGKYAPFDVTPAAGGLANLANPGRRSLVHVTLQHAARGRCASARAACGVRNEGGRDGRLLFVGPPTDV